MLMDERMMDSRTVSDPGYVPDPTTALERKNRAMVVRIIRVFFACGALFVAFRFGEYRGRGADDFGTVPIVPLEDAVFSGTDPGSRTIDFGLFWNVWDILREKYVDRSDLDANTLFYGAIDGMLAATGDPYTTFFDPEEQKAFDEDISGRFEGIGAEMGMRDQILTIIAPLEGAPAEVAGLRPNDKVLRIDDEPSTAFSLDEAVDRIRGPRGTEVRLTIYRQGEEESREIVVTRGLITVESVKTEYREDPGLAVIRVSRFGDRTEDDFRLAVLDAVAKGAKGVILDVRSNPGGLLDTAISMASLMLPPDTVVVIEENAAGDRREDRTRGGDRISRIPTVVLIDEGSASASEILAGALRENRDDVTLVGKKSYGKGSVQELIPTGRDTSVKVTIAKWLTPAGHQIHEKGIEPDVSVDLTLDDFTADRDPQMDKAVEILRERIGTR